MGSNVSSGVSKLCDPGQALSLSGPLFLHLGHFCLLEEGKILCWNSSAWHVVVLKDLSARPRAMAAAAGPEARSQGVAGPWPGTRSVVAAAAAVLCPPGCRAGAAAGERGPDRRRRRQPDRPRPKDAPLNPSQPSRAGSAPAFVPRSRIGHPGSGTHPRIRHALWARPRNHS